MSVPLERLYNFLHDVCNHDDVIIYRFFPHGSRKITDLTRIKSGKQYEAVKSDKFVICYDQEPLNFDLYTDITMFDELLEHQLEYAEVTKELLTDDLYKKYMRVLERTIKQCNLKLAIGSYMYDVPVILVHSEQRSTNLQKYQEHNFVTVYWWSHGLIAKDWFRYAELDPELDIRHATKDFLIYNRAWSGTREYRLKFAESLIENNLQTVCKMGFNPSDNKDYRSHRFSNPAFQIAHTDLENHFFLNTSPSTASADYVAVDYQTTEIEVVLETLFDDDRIQLTEKILRPIACGHPFIIAGTHGSLEYLRSYGFETFSNLINESYDSIVDPKQRLDAIVNEMKRISSLPSTEKARLFASMRSIAQKNKQLFFSKEWEQKIIEEYKTNFNQGAKDLAKKLREKFKNFSLL